MPQLLLSNSPRSFSTNPPRISNISLRKNSERLQVFLSAMMILQLLSMVTCLIGVIHVLATPAPPHLVLPTQSTNLTTVTQLEQYGRWPTLPVEYLDGFRFTQVLRVSAPPNRTTEYATECLSNLNSLIEQFQPFRKIVGFRQVSAGHVQFSLTHIRSGFGLDTDDAIFCLNGIIWLIEQYGLAELNGFLYLEKNHDEPTERVKGAQLAYFVVRLLGN